MSAVETTWALRPRPDVGVSVIATVFHTPGNGAAEVRIDFTASGTGVGTEIEGAAAAIVREMRDAAAAALAADPEGEDYRRVAPQLVEMAATRAAAAKRVADLEGEIARVSAALPAGAVATIADLRERAERARKDRDGADELLRSWEGKSVTLRKQAERLARGAAVKTVVARREKLAAERAKAEAELIAAAGPILTRFAVLSRSWQVGVEGASQLALGAAAWAMNQGGKAEEARVTAELPEPAELVGA
jgi:hypothetical protein